jgi:hypothetical protein
VGAPQEEAVEATWKACKPRHHPYRTRLERLSHLAGRNTALGWKHGIALGWKDYRTWLAEIPHSAGKDCQLTRLFPIGCQIL